MNFIIFISHLDHLHPMYQASYSITFGDIISKQIRTNMQWNLLNEHVYPFLILSKFFNNSVNVFMCFAGHIHGWSYGWANLIPGLVWQKFQCPETLTPHTSIGTAYSLEVGIFIFLIEIYLIIILFTLYHFIDLANTLRMVYGLP